MPTYEELRQLKRNDIVLRKNKQTNEFSLTLIYDIEDIPPTQKVLLQGLDLKKVLDFARDTAQDSDFAKRFKTEPDPHAAVAALKAEFTENLLDELDKLLKAFGQEFLHGANQELGKIMAWEPAFGLLDFRLDDAVDTVWLHPHPGAVRKHLLGGCPFDCNRGHLPNRDALAEIWPPSAEVSADAIADLQSANGPYRCPGCLGADSILGQTAKHFHIQGFGHAQPWNHDQTKTLWSNYLLAEVKQAIHLGYLLEEEEFAHGILKSMLLSQNTASPTAVLQSMAQVQDALAVSTNLHFSTVFAQSLPFTAAELQTLDNSAAQLTQEVEAALADTTAQQTLLESLMGADPTQQSEPPRQPKSSRLDLIDGLTTAPYELWMSAHERIGNDCCAICKFVPYEKGDTIVGLLCGHFYQKDCLSCWVKEYNDCPFCRKQIPGFTRQVQSNFFTLNVLDPVEVVNEEGEHEAEDGASQSVVIGLDSENESNDSDEGGDEDVDEEGEEQGEDGEHQPVHFIMNADGDVVVDHSAVPDEPTQSQATD